ANTLLSTPLLARCAFSLWFLPKGSSPPPPPPPRMQQSRRLAPPRHYRSLLGVFPSSRGELLPPAPQITVFSKRPQNVVRPLHQKRPQILVTLFADVHLRLTFAGVPPPRLQPHKTSRVATLAKPMWVLEGQHIGRGDEVAHTLHLFEQRRLRIRLFGHLCNPPIVFLDAFVERFHLSQQRLQGLAQFRAQSTRGLPTELLRATLAQPLAVGLHQSS